MGYAIMPNYCIGVLVSFLSHGATPVMPGMDLAPLFYRLRALGAPKVTGLDNVLCDSALSRAC